MTRVGEKGVMGKVAPYAVVGILLCLRIQAIASPGTAGNCGACHYHMNLFPGATTVTNSDTTAAPNPALGLLKVIQVQPGQTRMMQFSVGGWSADPNWTGLPDLYATSFRGFTAAGLNGNALKFTGDSAWTGKTDYTGLTYYYSSIGSYSGFTQSWGFTITVDPTTKPDYYLLDFTTGIYQNPSYGQVGIHGREQFYLQVVPRLPGDINTDGYVNVGDLQKLIAAWGSNNSGSWGNWNAAADLNYDGYVNVSDLQLLVTNWGRLQN